MRGFASPVGAPTTQPMPLIMRPPMERHCASEGSRVDVCAGGDPPGAWAGDALVVCGISMAGGAVFLLPAKCHAAPAATIKTKSHLVTMRPNIDEGFLTPRHGGTKKVQLSRQFPRVSNVLRKIGLMGERQFRTLKQMN